MARSSRRNAPVRRKRSTPSRGVAHRQKSSGGSARPKGRPSAAVPVEIDPGRIEATLSKLREQLVSWTNKGRYTKVRFKFRGKQLLPDLPLAAMLAAEGLTFYWGGILRALIVNLAGKTVLDVELVNESEKQIQRGKEELLAGEVDKALQCFREALAMDGNNPRVHLNLGVALKLKGDLAAARKALERARSLDAGGPVGSDAERLLSGLDSGVPTGSTPAQPP